MRKMILMALLIPLMAACAGESGTRIRIEAANYDAEKMNIAWLTPDGDFKVEPITIENGKGEVTIDVPEGTNINLASLDSRSNIKLDEGMIPGPGFSFYAEKGTTTISFDAEKWPVLTIKGGKLNKDMNSYWEEMGPLQARSFDLTRQRLAQGNMGGESAPNPEAGKVQEEMSRVQEGFIAAHPGSLLSLDILNQRFMQYSLEEFESRFNKLDASVKESEKGKAVAERIAKAKSVLPGNPAPEFTKKDKDGNTVSLAGFRGKYVLIDFWGTWCGPCRSSHPHLVDLYNKYSGLGLEFINIAQEGGKDPRPGWLKAIEEDGLVWTQILNDEGSEECDVVGLYSVQAFPTKVLIDKQGRLVATWIGDSPEVDSTLEEIFGV